MAKATSIGNLRTELTLDSKKFNKGVDKAKKKVKGLAAGFGGLKGAIGGILSAGLLVKFTKDAIEAADSVAKFADRAGITTDALQEMRFAFDLAGVGVEAVDKAFLTFGKRLGKARQGIGALVGGLKGGEEELLAMLLATKNTTEAIEIMFKAMQEAESQTRKLAIADAAFGMAGLRMTAAFKGGADAFGNARRQAQALGIVLDEDVIRNAETTKDKITVLTTVLKTKFQAVLLDLTPLIGEVAEKLLSMVQSFQALAGNIFPATLSIKGLNLEIKFLEMRLDEIAKKADDFEFLDLFGTPNEISGIESKLGVLKALLNEKEKALAESQRNKPVESVGLSEEELFNQSDAVENVGEANKKLMDSYDGLFLAAGQVKGQIGELTETQIKANAIYAASRGEIESLQVELLELHEVFRSIENDNQQILDVEIFQKRKEQIEQAIRDIEEFQNQTVFQFQDLVESIGDSLGNFIFNQVTKAENFLEGLKNFAREVAQDILSEFIKIQTVQPFVKFLSGAIGNLFSGTVSTPNAPVSVQAAHGAQFTVGGKAGIDANLINLHATRGERVTVETPEQQRAGATPGITLNFSTGISQTVRAEIQNLMPIITETIIKSVANARNRGGKFQEAFS